MRVIFQAVCVAAAAAHASASALDGKEWLKEAHLRHLLASHKDQRKAAGTLMVSSTFYSDSEGWSVEGTEGKISHDGSNGKIFVKDGGANAWYFVAPEKFLGEKSAAYNGKLTFNLGHYYFNSDDKKPIEADADIILESLCDWTLTTKVYKEYEMSHMYSVTLNEDSGWTDSRTSNPPDLMDFLGMLSNLKSIKIRGGYFVKEETTNLGDVQLLEGTAWKPCCNAADRIDYCAVPGSPFFNPPDLKFYCLGHGRQEVVVSAVKPRYIRKSGGTLMTIIGENFGLTRSEPIIKIDGQICKQRSVDQHSVTQTMLKCESPPKKEGSDGTDVSVTVTAFAYNQQDEYESSSTNCITAAARKLSYFGHDVVWYKHIYVTGERKTVSTVTIASVATNRNTGAVYVCGHNEDEIELHKTKVKIPAPPQGGQNIWVAKWSVDRHKPDGDTGHEHKDDQGQYKMDSQETHTDWHAPTRTNVFQWARNLGTLSQSSINFCTALMVDNFREEAYAVGYIMGREEQVKFATSTWTIGEKEYTANVPDPRVPDQTYAAVIVKYDAKGDVMFSSYGRAESSTLTTNSVYAWAADVFRGEIYVTGYYDEQIQDPAQRYLFGNENAGYKTLAAVAYTEKGFWLAKFHGLKGKPIWVTRATFGLVNGEVYGKAIDVYKGHVFVGGWFYHTVSSNQMVFYEADPATTVQGGDKATDLKASLTSNQECYIVEYNLDGKPLKFVVTSGALGTTACQVYGIAIYRNYLHAVGRYYADASVIKWKKDKDGAEIVMPSTSSVSDYDAFIIQFTYKDMLPTWCRHLKNTGIYQDGFAAVAVDDYYSEIYAAGHFGNNIRVPYNAEKEYQLRIGDQLQQKGCAIKYNHLGDAIWAKTFKASGPWISEVTAVATMDTDIWLAGIFESSIMMVDPPGEDVVGINDVLTARGKFDSFLVKLKD
jgi:hypothetical protein